MRMRDDSHFDGFNQMSRWPLLKFSKGPKEVTDEERPGVGSTPDSAGNAGNGRNGLEDKALNKGRGSGGATPPPDRGET